MAAERRADVVWEGSLLEGSGTVTRTGSGALPELPVTWGSRTESSEGRTSPEELIAAAHASCFSMALSGALTKAGNPPAALRTRAEVDFQPGEGITGVRLAVSGDVPGLDAEGFRDAAENAKENCPVSKALAVPISLSVD
jgi:lipoyl-dependent peroxiredoxin